MWTVSHSGDAGDAVSSLAACQKLFETTGEKGVFTIYDHPQNKRITQSIFDSWKSLIEAQPYISSVEWKNSQHISHDFSTFRVIYSYGEHLASQQARWVGVKDLDLNKKWIHLPNEPVYNKDGPVVIARSVRYHNDSFPWQKIIDFFGDDIVCINPDEEYNQLRNETQREMRRQKCSNFLEIAQAIASSRLFICNQTSCWHVAEGMKHLRINETHADIHDSVWIQDGATYCMDGELVIRDPKTGNVFENKPYRKRVKKSNVTKPMVIALPYMSQERQAWFHNLNYFKHLQDYKDYSAAIVCGYDTHANFIYGAAKELFKKVDVYHDEKVVNGWPQGPNQMFRFTAEVLKDAPFFFLESDNIPTKEYWLDSIYNEYQTCGKPFMGAFVEGTVPGGHLNGSGIFDNVQKYAPAMLDATSAAFDVQGADQARPHTHFSNLFYHLWKWRGVSPEVNNQAEASYLLSLQPDAVVFHRSKNAMLTKLLRERFARDLKQVRQIRDVMQGMPGGYHFKDDFGNYILANSFNGLVERVRHTYHVQKRDTREIREIVIAYITRVAPIEMLEEKWI